MTDPIFRNVWNSGKIKTTTVDGAVEQTSRIIVQELSKCTTLYDASQIITISCNPSAQLVKDLETSPLCLSCQKNNDIADCPQCHACVISDTHQEETMVLKTSCSIENDSPTIHEAIVGKITDALNNEDGDLSALQKKISELDTDLDLKTVTTEFEKLVILKNVTDLLNAVKSTQVIKFRIDKGGAIINGVHQEIVVYQASRLVSKNMIDIGLATSNTNIHQHDKLHGDDNENDTHPGGDGTVGYISIVVAVVLVMIIAAVSFYLYKLKNRSHSQ